MKILVINSGSSSLKYQFIDMETKSVLAKGICDAIGSQESFLEHKANGQKTILNQFIKDHKEAIELVLKTLADKNIGAIKSLTEIHAVGHRVLHGGEIYLDSVVVDDEVMKNLETLKPLGPLHMPANINGIEACRQVMPNVPQVAVFDTAFHSKMPAEAFMYALPYEDYTELKIRKYGFHGTSHKYLAEETAKLLGKDVKDVKIITLHIGNGASVAAVKDGRSIDTSMGYTPLEGLVMGTRSGDIDPSVLSTLCSAHGMNLDEGINYLNKKSGILGIHGTSNDLRVLDADMLKGNERAKLAMNMITYRIKKYIGAYIAALGGVDALTFAGGGGENDRYIRELSLEGLEFLGIKIDKEKNKNLPKGTNEELSTADSKVKIYRIPTDEELAIAIDTEKLTKNLRK